MSRTKVLVAAVLLTACGAASDDAATAPRRIEAFAAAPRAPGKHAGVELNDGDRPVVVNVWTPPAGAPVAGLVIVSHGSQSKGSLHTYLGEHLSAWGYLVLAPNHYGDTLGTPATDTVYPDRVADLKRVLDEAATRPAWTPYLQAGVAAVGHSIGGFDALALCGAAVDEAAVNAECAAGHDLYCTLARDRRQWASYADDRVATCVGLTPFVHPIFGGEGQGAAGLTRPTLLLGATKDPILLLEPYLRDFFRHTPADSPLLEITGAGHLDFTDLLHDGTLPHATLKEIVDAYVTAWLAARLHGDTAAAALFAGEAVAAGAYGGVVRAGTR